MADQVLTKQKLINADEDLGDLEEVLNGPPGKLIKTRLGREVYTLASVPQINTMTREEVAAAVAPKANKADVDEALSNLSTNANKFYPTLAEANYYIAQMAVNDVVTVGEEANKGLWYKATAGATTLTKSAFDPIEIAKQNPLFKPKGLTNENLNDLPAGHYIQNSPPENAVTELNYPLKQVCLISVYVASGSSLLFQEISYTDGRTFLRVRTGSSWGVTEIRSLKNSSILSSDLTIALKNQIRQRLEFFAVASNPNISYDPSTYTLTWGHQLIASNNIGTTSRVIIPSGSKVFTAPTGNNYQIMYLDLTMIPSNGTVSLDAIKIGSYGTFNDSFDQVPLAKLDSRGNIAPCAGFLPITTVGKAEPKQTVALKKTTTTSQFFIQMSNGKFARIQFDRTQIPFDPSNELGQRDNWGLGYCHEVNTVGGLLNRVIIAGGEWDSAIQVMGATDHSGGVHGDELLTNAYFIINNQVEPQDFVFDGEVKEFTFAQESILYFEHTQNPLFKRTKRMTVTKDGIKNYQKLESMSAANLYTAWVTMLPIRRNENGANGNLITDTALRSDMSLEDISTTTFPRSYKDVKEGDTLKIFGQQSKISAEITFLKLKGMPSPTLHISNDPNYNKVYFSAIDSRVANYQLKAGEVWEIETLIKFDAL